MKCIVFLCALLAVVSAIDADEVTTSRQGLLDPTKILWRIVNYEKEGVEAVQDDLIKFQKETYEKLETKLNEIKTSGMVEVEKLVKGTLETVKKEVMKAKHDGKNAEVCYETAKNLVNAVSDNSNAALGTCLTNALNTVEAPLQNIGHAIQTASQMIADLDAIVPNCYSSIFIKMQNCVLRKTFLARTTLRNLQSTARSVKWTASRSTVNVIASSRSCSTKVVSDARTTTTEVGISSARCIRDVETVFMATI